VVRKDDAGDRASRRERDLEGVTFHLAGDGTGEREARLRVVDAGREDEGRPAATLFVAGLWIRSRTRSVPAKAATFSNSGR
jgi:hypothetical protein